MNIEMDLGSDADPVRVNLVAIAPQDVTYVNGYATRMPLASAIAQAGRLLDALRLLATEAADEAFIVAAREDVPALVARVRELEQEVRRLQSELREERMGRDL